MAARLGSWAWVVCAEERGPAELLGAKPASVSVPDSRRMRVSIDVGARRRRDGIRDMAAPVENRCRRRPWGWTGESGFGGGDSVRKNAQDESERRRR